MSNCLKGLLIFTFLILFTASFASAQEIFVVDDDGDPLTTYPTLAAAVATAKTFPGGPHYIEVMEGSYSDAGLVIDASIISIVGVGDPAATIFQAPTYQAVNFMDVSGTVGFILSGMTVMDYLYGLVGTDVTDLQVASITFENNGEDGGTISPFADDGGAIRLKNCDDGMFDDLHIFDGERGLRLDANGGADGSDGNTIQNCEVHDNEQYGIAIYPNGDNNLIDNCEVYNIPGDRGIQIGFSANAGNVVNGCTVYDCSNDGILNSGATSGSITNNTVYNCATTTTTMSSPGTQAVHGGIWAGGALVVSGNNSYNNGDGAGVGDYGLYVDGYWCNITDNCFYGHFGTQVYDAGIGASSNLWAGNYYGDIAAGAGSYAILPGFPTVDLSPATRMNNPTAVSSTIEVWDNFTVDFEFTLPSTCDATDFVELALYEFTVTWDPTMLDFVYGSNGEFLGVPGDALYIITGDPSLGSITFSGTNFDTPNAGAGILASIDFQAIKTGPATVTTSSTYRDVDNADIPVGSTPLALTLVDTEAPTIDVTANNPIGDDTYSDGSGNVLMYVEGNVADNYALKHVHYRFNGGGGWMLVETVTGTSDTYGDIGSSLFYVDITGLTEGANVLNLRVRDQSNNPGYVDYNFGIDWTGPDVAALALADSDGCADAGFTSNDVVDVSWTNGDGSAVEHQFYYNGAWGGVMAYANPTTYTLDGTEATHQIWVRQYDVYGNMGPQMGPVAIVLDKTAPTPSALVLDGGAAKTNTASINADANQDVPGGATHIAWSETSGDLTCAGATWIAAPIHPFAVTLSAGDGVKTVYMVSKDAAGNVSAAISDDIELDATAPEFDAFAVTATDGSECDPDYNVAVTFEWTDADAKWIKLFSIKPSDPADTSSIAPVDISTATSPFTVVYAIPSGYRVNNGLNVVHGFLEDDIGNAGSSMSDDVFRDGTNPTITSIEATDLDYDGVDPTLAVNWSDNAEVQLEIIGLAADVVELQFSETGAFAGEETTVAITSADPFNMNYTFATTTGCTFDILYVKAFDCAGRSSAAVFDQIKFDFDDPSITDFSVTSSDPTNVLSATVNIDAIDNCLEWKWQVYEDGYEGSGSGWTTIAGLPDTYILALQDIGDGTRTLHLMVTDPAGNVVATTTTVDVDQTDPTGTFVIQQFGNPLAMAGYTNSLTDNEFVSIAADADAVQMRFKDDDGSVTGWEAVAATKSPFTIGSAPAGAKTVSVKFKDAAGNVGTWVDGSITYLDGVGLVPPPSAMGVPGNSITLDWAPVAVAQSYYVKYNFTGQLPVYVDGIPPNPGAISGDTLEGIFAANIADTHYVFEGPHPDIYAVSIWTIDMAGNLSLTCNVDVVETNYTLGDLDYDGEVEFVDDFGDFAAAYSLSFGESGFNDHADFGPTSDSSGTGYPMPDATINVEDLAIMGMNYNASASAAGKEGNIIPIGPKPAAQSMRLDAELTYLGKDIVISITSNNADAMMLYNFVFDLKTDDAEVINVEAGSSFDNTETSWFYHNQRSSFIDVTGIVLGEDIFDGELARITIRTEATDIDLENVELIVRDRYNQNVDIEFTVVNKLEILPTEFGLRQNYPNPFNPATTIELSLPVASDYSLKIYNVTGQVVETFEGYSEAGTKTIVWEASKYSSGIYFYRVEANSFIDTKKMVLLK